MIESKCIDCGECIRVCPHRAKLANTDPLPVFMNLIIALPSLHRH
ncbi:4Fe-4S binding protein [Eubacterium aggregans]